MSPPPTNSSSCFSVATPSLTVWYATYFNQYTHKIQIVPPGAPAPCAPGGNITRTVGSILTAPRAVAELQGARATLSARRYLIKDASASITGASSSIRVDGTTIIGGTLTISGGEATIVGGRLVVIGGLPITNGGITTITGGTATIEGGTVSMRRGDVTVAGGAIKINGTLISYGSPINIPAGNVARVSISGGKIDITGGTLTITGTANVQNGAVTIDPASATISGGTAMISGDRAIVTTMSAGSGTGGGMLSAYVPFHGGAVRGAMALTMAREEFPLPGMEEEPVPQPEVPSPPTPAPPPAVTGGPSNPSKLPSQDLAKTPDSPGAVAAPDTLKIQWDPSYGCGPDYIDVEILITYRSRQGVYRATKVPRSGDSYTVSLKTFGDAVMKQILLTNCYDLCGSIELDGDAEVLVYPYCPPGPMEPADAVADTDGTSKNAPPELRPSSTPAKARNTLPVRIQAKPFSGAL